MTSGKNKKIVIVGGGAGGASAAAKLRRLSEDYEIIIIERTGYVSYANCGLPYHIGGTIKERDNLFLNTPEQLGQKFNLDVRANTDVIAVDREEKTIRVQNSMNGQDCDDISYDKLILSPGGTPFIPPVEGLDHIDILTLRTVEDMDEIIKLVSNTEKQRIAIVGGGLVGVELAENLEQLSHDVSVVELSDQLFAFLDKDVAMHVHKSLIENNVHLYLSKKLVKVAQTDDCKQLVFDNGDSIDVDIIVFAIGVRPDTSFIKDTGLELNAVGGIKVTEHLQTSDPDIYALGDAIEVNHFVSEQSMLIPLAGPANKQGRVVAQNVHDENSVKQDFVTATTICKVFDLSVGAVGLNEKMLQRMRPNDNDWYEVINIHPNAHAKYYPGCQALHIKVIFSKEDKQILGAQVTGHAGVDKSIDVLSTVIRLGGNVESLSHLETAYAPPYNSARDPLNYIGFIAENLLSNKFKQLTLKGNDDLSDYFLVDVRTPMEYEFKHISNAVNIPFAEIRSRLSEFPRDKKILVCCNTGLNSYNVCCILSHNGFDCYNLSGGMHTYAILNTHLNEVQPITRRELPIKDDLSDVDIMHLDLCGLACPGPILKLQEKFETIPAGHKVKAVASDSTFLVDITRWAEKTGNILLDSYKEDSDFIAYLQKPGGTTAIQNSELSMKKTVSMKEENQDLMIMISNKDIPRISTALMVGSTAAAMGRNVTIFFIFDGLDILRKQKGSSCIESDQSIKIADKGFFQLWLEDKPCKKENSECTIISIPEYLVTIRDLGGRFIACSMAMELLGLTMDDLIEGVEPGGMMTYLSESDECGHKIFV